MSNTTAVLQKLRDVCISRGANGIVSLSRTFRILDENRDRKLNKDELIVGLKEYGADLTDEEVTELFTQLDKDGSGTVTLEEFLRAVRPPISKARMDIICEAFSKMDRTADGVVTLEDVKGIYTAKEHPDVVSGKKTEDEVLLEFIGTFETMRNQDGKITKEEFIDYYAGLSASIDEDVYFVEMVQRAWKL